MLGERTHRAIASAVRVLIPPCCIVHVSYAGVCVAYAALSLLPVPLWWDFYWANVAMLGGSLLVMAYNGGAFYTDVFSRKYAAKHGLALSA